LETFTPQLELATLFVLDEEGRITGTREPHPSPGPRFMLIRGTTSCAWATRVDIPRAIATELRKLADTEPPTLARNAYPVHAERYRHLVGGRSDSGPAYTFRQQTPPPDAVVIQDVAVLQPHFQGWAPDEVPGCSPIFGILDHGVPVSICFCARQSPVAAEAGLETAPGFRGRGFGGRVAVAWAEAIRASGRLPLYSTSWSNAASLAVARKLRLDACASHWSLRE
jgi:hypothetical protein